MPFELMKADYFDGAQLQNPIEQNKIIPLTDYFNEKICDVYLGIPKNTPGDKNIRSIGIIAVCSLLVAILIAGLFARTITDPVLKLVQAAESISLGDLEHQIKIKGNDEI